MGTKRIPVSVLIITKNRELLFRRCLMSLINQSAHPSEVVVIDSSDKKLTIPGDFNKTLAIRHIHNVKLTIPQARSVAMSAAISDYVLFLDDDCELEASGLAKYHSHMIAKHPADFVMGALQLVNHQNPYASVQDVFYQIWMLENFSSASGIQAFRNGMPLHFDSALIKKNAFSGVRFNSDAPALFQDDDIDIGVQLFNLGKHMVYDASILTRYTGRQTMFSLLCRGFATGFSNQYIRQIRRIDVHAVTYTVSVADKITLILRKQKQFDVRVAGFIFLIATALYMLASKIGRLFFYAWRLQRTV